MPALRPLLVATFVLGCSRTLPAPPAARPASVLDQARARPIPTPLTARFSFKIRSEALDLAGSTGGALIVDRPGRGHLAVLGPLGGPLLTVQTDGLGLAVALPKDQRHLVALDAEQVLRETTGGIAGLDDLLGLMLGDLPLDAAAVLSEQRREDGDLAVVLEGPAGTSLLVVIDDLQAAPVSLEARDADGKVVLTASYEPFAPREGDLALLPTRVQLHVPLLELDLDVRYKSWSTPDPVPDVFGLGPPPGFHSEPLEDAVRDVAGALVREAAAAGGAEPTP